MESYIRLSNIADFIFCPKSIYYHNIYDSYDKTLYQEESQIAGTIAHESIDNRNYSSRKDTLQGLEVYNEYYKICGKIDLFYLSEGRLVERKNKVSLDVLGKGKIYKEYKYQLWGQMFCLEEMGYKVHYLQIYSMTDNKVYKVRKPTVDDILDFEHLIEKYRHFDMLSKSWRQNTEKCRRCIYRELCDYFIGEIYPQLSLFENKQDDIK